jgi:hypothetical protein
MEIKKSKIILYRMSEKFPMLRISTTISDNKTWFLFVLIAASASYNND